MFSSNTSQVSNDAVFVEDVFSTYLYTGNGSTQTITNGIDLSTYGGLVWTKERDSGSYMDHCLIDTTLGNYNTLCTNNTNGAYYGFNRITSWNTTGYTLSGTYWGYVNEASKIYASWTFRKQPKFFDVVTWTQNSSSKTIPHTLGATPGCVIIKRTNSAGQWYTYHRSLTSTNYYLALNQTYGEQDAGVAWITPTPTDITVTTAVADSGGTYVAYLFAHNAGGFGLTGTDNVISCGSFTSSASPVTVTLGYEPQWLLIKRADGATGDWYIIDNMRSMSYTNTFALNPNSSAAEANFGAAYFVPTPTGFTVNSGWTSDANTWIYIAIRRGPMKTPTTGTSVYTSASRTGTASVIPRFTSNFVVDWALRKSDVTTGGGDWQAGDRLRGGVQVKPNLTEAETAAATLYTFDSMTGYSTLGSVGSNTADRSWMFRRAPGFFDEVCYTGTGSSPNTQSHNLGVVPELVIVKSRTTAYNWAVWHSFTGSDFKLQYLNTTAAAGTISYSSTYMPSAPTASQIAFGTTTLANDAGGNYVAYLFASCPGVSKVGSYTGNGSTQTINCGFTGGARFVLIKRTDSTGDWYVWDTARGMVSGTDPSLLLNSTAAEVNANSIYTTTGGFQIVSTAAGINASGGSYIFLAIA